MKQSFVGWIVLDWFLDVFSSCAFGGTGFFVVRLRDDIETSLGERSQACRNYEVAVTRITAPIPGLAKRRANIASSKKGGTAQGALWHDREL
ncbi:hypothetical protein N9S30_00175, partial [bacterium]|nr:hypothetical protein [bacterium]